MEHPDIKLDPGEFVVKDSGNRTLYPGGMQRDTTDDKVDWSLIADGPMLERWAEHLSKGAKKYAPRNWMLAEGAEEEERFRESAFRHFMQWWYGETDEDHASAIFFNINGYEYLVAKRTAQLREEKWNMIRGMMTPSWGHAQGE